MYMVKKELRKDVYKAINCEGDSDPYELLFRILSQAEFRPYFTNDIEFEAWQRQANKRAIPMKA